MTKNNLKIAFLGDIGLNDIDDEIKIGMDFDPIKKFLSSYDFVSANLETPVSVDDSVNKFKNPRVSADLSNFKYLKYFNLKFVSLANNHIFDCLEKGYEKTTEILNSYDIEYNGASNTLDSKYKPYVLNISQNNKIYFFNFVSEYTNPNIPGSSKFYLNNINDESISYINNFPKNKGDIFIIQLHWGKDFVPFPSLEQRKIAYEFINNGADLIIGHHPHVISPFESYKNKYIFYSLGNFFFPDIKFENKKLVWPKLCLRSIIPIFEIIDNNIALVNIFRSEMIHSKINIREIDISEVIKMNNLIFPVLYKIKYFVYVLYYYKIREFFRFFFGRDKNIIDQFKKINIKRIKKILE